MNAKNIYSSFFDKIDRKKIKKLNPVIKKRIMKYLMEDEMYLLFKENQIIGYSQSFTNYCQMQQIYLQFGIKKNNSKNNLFVNLTNVISSDLKLNIIEHKIDYIKYMYMLNYDSKKLHKISKIKINNIPDDKINYTIKKIPLFFHNFYFQKYSCYTSPLFLDKKKKFKLIDHKFTNDDFSSLQFFIVQDDMLSKIKRKNKIYEIKENNDYLIAGKIKDYLNFKKLQSKYLNLEPIQGNNFFYSYNSHYRDNYWIEILIMPNSFYNRTSHISTFEIKYYIFLRTGNYDINKLIIGPNFKKDVKLKLFNRICSKYSYKNIYFHNYDYFYIKKIITINNKFTKCNKCLRKKIYQYKNKDINILENNIFDKKKSLVFKYQLEQISCDCNTMYKNQPLLFTPFGFIKSFGKKLFT